MFTVQHEVLDMKMCPDENYLLLKVKIRNWEFIIGTVTFITNIPIFIKARHYVIKLWKYTNCWWFKNKISIDNLFNIDAVNVKQIPNPQNSAILGEWIDNSFLIDIFRQLYPERKVYSHIPFNRYLQAVISGT